MTTFSTEDRESLLVEIERISTLFDVCDMRKAGLQHVNDIEPFTWRTAANPAHWIFAQTVARDASGSSASSEAISHEVDRDGGWSRSFLKRVHGHVNIAIAGNMLVNGAPSDGLGIHSFRSMTPREQRGRCRGQHANALMYRISIVDVDGSTNSVDCAFGLFGKEWRNIDTRDRSLWPNDHQLMIEFGLATQATRPEQWRVGMRFGNNPPISFVTDPIGTRECFALRELPAGRKRRDALLHWVREHWRVRRSVDAVDIDWVRRHLRGARKFTWNGLTCEVSPPESEELRATP